MRHRYTNPERTAWPRRTVDANLSMLRLHELPGNRQPQPRSPLFTGLRRLAQQDVFDYDDLEIQRMPTFWKLVEAHMQILAIESHFLLHTR